jgi:hypothetical protein
MLLIVVSNYYCNTTGVTSGPGTAYPSRAHEFTWFLVRCVLLDLYFFGVESVNTNFKKTAKLCSIFT